MRSSARRSATPTSRSRRRPLFGSRCGWRGDPGRARRPGGARGGRLLRSADRCSGVLLETDGEAARGRGLVERDAAAGAVRCAGPDRCSSAPRARHGLDRGRRSTRAPAPAASRRAARDQHPGRLRRGRRHRLPGRRRRGALRGLPPRAADPSGGRDTLVATAVMVWDSAGAWQQTVFDPPSSPRSAGGSTRGAPVGRPLYWRRLQPISDVAYRAGQPLDGAGERAGRLGALGHRAAERQRGGGGGGDGGSHVQ